MTAIEQYRKEHEEEINAKWRELYPLPSAERSKEIIEASKSIQMDDHNPEAAWNFKEGESPIGWYDAQVRAINHFGHIFCINPYYSNSSEKWYGYEFKSTQELMDFLNKCNSHQEYLNMTMRTIAYLKLNCDVEFPNGWGDQFPETA